ncbi:hypothetical protein GQQ15_18080 [Pantoea agglomerans]|nr:hypothetical protein [Pantoea agglomerans]NEH09298.1 hypothetical protein [Pantoea agglomerans]
MPFPPAFSLMPARLFCPHGEELRETSLKPHGRNNMSQQSVNTTASESRESSSPKPKTQRRPAKAKADKAAVAAVEQALEKIDIEMIPLSRLAISSLNVRSKIYVQSRIESLAATIKNVGLMHNLIAHDMADGMLGVACGGRRFIAMQLLLSQGVYQPDQLIPVIWRGSAAELANSGKLAVFPAQGWWRTRQARERYDSDARYSLIVSIHVPGVDVDLLTPVEVKVETLIQNAVHIVT